MTAVRKAVIPVAGLGTRFLPITKSVPKEMLPIVNKPTLQYAVEEAAASGITEIIFVMGPGKEVIRDYFTPRTTYTAILEARGKATLLEPFQQLLEPLTITYAWQEEQKGLGHAVWCAKKEVGNEPFLILLPDMIFHADTPCSKQLIEAYHTVRTSAIATHSVPRDQTKSYGVLDMEGDAAPYRIRGLVEKPSPDKAPSTYVISGRYLLMPSIFELIEKTTPGAIGEIQITDAMNQQAKTEGMAAVPFKGKIFDTGTPSGFIEANQFFFEQA